MQNICTDSHALRREQAPPKRADKFSSGRLHLGGVGGQQRIPAHRAKLQGVSHGMDQEASKGVVCFRAGLCSLGSPNIKDEKPFMSQAPPPPVNFHKTGG